MTEVLVWVFIVAVLSACAGFVFGVVIAGGTAFENGRAVGRREAKREVQAPGFRVVS